MEEESKGRVGGVGRGEGGGTAVVGMTGGRFRGEGNYRVSLGREGIEREARLWRAAGRELAVNLLTIPLQRWQLT